MDPGETKIIGIGEVLWDLLPSGKQLGGAPCNFAFHCAQLGHPSAIFSRIGQDPLGQELHQRLVSLGFNDHLLQLDSQHETGTVSVSVDGRGQPTFTIHENVAWDFLEWDDSLAEVFAQAQAVCFGTLIQRHPKARAAVERALEESKNALVVFDVNLRQRYYSRQTLEESLVASDWAKLNDDELATLKDLLALHGSSEADLMSDLRRRYGLELVALTRGENGCLVQRGDEQVEAQGEKITVVDTIGAGDAFTAGLVVSVLEGIPLNTAARLANRLAARVAASAGGTPRLDRSELESSLE